MNTPISDLKTLLGSLNPHLHEDVYVYSSVSFDTDLNSVSLLGTFREAEGLTIILTESEAKNAGFPILFRAAWITLTVNSALEAIGLTAAFSAALANAQIGCNVVAGAFHDHIFVPYDRSEDAMTVIREISAADSTVA